MGVAFDGFLVVSRLENRAPAAYAWIAATTAVGINFYNCGVCGVCGGGGLGHAARVVKVDVLDR